MSRTPLLAGALFLAMASTAMAGPFVNPDLDNAYNNLVNANTTIIVAQFNNQLIGRFDLAQGQAYVIAMTSGILGQLNSAAPWINASPASQQLMTELSNAASRANYYAQTDFVQQQQFYTGTTPPNPAAESQAEITAFNSAMGDQASLWPGPGDYNGPDPGPWSGGDDGGGDSGGEGGDDPSWEEPC